MADPPEILRTADVPEMGTAEPEAEIEQLLKARAKKKPKRKQSQRERGKRDHIPAGAIAPQLPRPTVLRDARGRLLPGAGAAMNPGGKSYRWREAQKYAEGHAMEAIDFLVFVVRDPLSKTSDRLTAAEMLLNRGLGKAVERAQIELTNTDTDKAEEKQSLVIGEQKITF